MSLGHPSFPILGTFACSREAAVYLCHVRPSVYISAATTGRISLKFDTVDFYVNLSTKSRICYNLTETSVTLRVGLSMFYCNRRHKVAVKAFLTTMCVEQQYNRNVLLHFHIKKGKANPPQCYTIRTLIMLFIGCFLTSSFLFFCIRSILWSLAFVFLISACRFGCFLLPLLCSHFIPFYLVLSPFLFFLSIRLSKSVSATLPTEYVFSRLKPFIV